MTKHSLRAKWNTANAQLANKPFDQLFAMQHKDHPAYVEGWTAFEDGTRRGANPYGPKGPEAARNAWYAGWDAAWEKSNRKNANGKEGRCQKYSISSKLKF